jgi:hypothetical protein
MNKPYQWKEKQIAAAIARLSQDKGWLKAKDFRSGNKAEASDRRALMKLLVDQGHAFDNGESWESIHYEISAKRACGIFPRCVLTSWKSENFPPQSFLTEAEGLARFQYLLGRHPCESDYFAWIQTSFKWAVIRHAIEKIQASGDIKAETHGFNLIGLKLTIPRTNIDISDDLDIEVTISEWEQEARILACMYEALVTGWEVVQPELEKLYPDWGICGRNPNAVFLALVKAQCEVDLALSCLMRSGGNSETHYRRILTIRSKHPGAGKSFTEYSQRDLESVAKAFEENERRKDYLEAERLLWKRQDPRVEAIADSQAHKLDTYLLYLLLESPDPEVQAKAKAWQESIHKGMDLAMQRIRARRNSTS